MGVGQENTLLVLWRMVKKVIHTITGRSEVERIVSDTDCGPREGAFALWKSLERSKWLSKAYDLVTSSAPDEEAAYQEIVRFKLHKKLSEER